MDASHANSSKKPENQPLVAAYRTVEGHTRAAAERELGSMMARLAKSRD